LGVFGCLSAAAVKYGPYMLGDALLLLQRMKQQ
jgi:hypothetical protein